MPIHRLRWTVKVMDYSEGIEVENLLIYYIFCVPPLLSHPEDVRTANLFGRCCPFPCVIISLSLLKVCGFFRQHQSQSGRHFLAQGWKSFLFDSICRREEDLACRISGHFLHNFLSFPFPTVPVKGCWTNQLSTSTLISSPSTPIYHLHQHHFRCRPLSHFSLKAARWFGSAACNATLSVFSVCWMNSLFALVLVQPFVSWEMFALENFGDLSSHFRRSCSQFWVEREGHLFLQDCYQRQGSLSWS